MKRLITYILFMLMPLVILAQEEKVFSQDEFLWLLGNYHPVAKQSELLIQRGEREIRKARGGFDPYLYADFDQKQFDDKNYFSIFDAGLKIPTWYGVEFQTGYDRNDGEFLNPENSTPIDGLWYAGVSVNIGKGLVIDDRRRVLRQAQLYQEATLAEQKLMLNDLYFEAMKEYWQWFEAYNSYLVFDSAMVLAQDRFEAIKQSHFLGELPAIDTLEAFLQVQNREVSKNEAWLNYQKAGWELSNFLWYENATPLELDENAHPPSYDILELPLLIGEEQLELLAIDLRENHPELQLYMNKQASLEIEGRYKKEQLKPDLSLNYNFLSAPTNNGEVISQSMQNYKWGLSFSIPILLREERGAWQVNQLKQRDMQWQRQEKQLELENKLRSYYTQQDILYDQIELFSSAVVNYESLLDGERQKFDSGESSLFLINSRETSLIQAVLKYINILSKFQVTELGVQWAGGRLYESFSALNNENELN